MCQSDVHRAATSTDAQRNSLTNDFTLGINYPWISYGYDFGFKANGTLESVGLPAPFPQAEVQQRLAGLRQLQIKMVRWFILCDGRVYPNHPADRLAIEVRGAQGRSPAQMAVDSAPPLPDVFGRDFRLLMEACRAASVQLTPVFLDFGWFNDLTMEHRYAYGGRRNYVVDHMLDSFLGATLRRLLEWAKEVDPTGEVIYAWDVMNEPDWIVEGGPVNLHTQQSISAQDLCRFLDRAIDEIHEVFPDARATIGFATPGRPGWVTNRLWNRLRSLARHGKYIHQFHYYPTALGPHELPACRESPIHPCFLGEFSTGAPTTTLQTHWPDLGGLDDDARRRLYRRLNLIDSIKRYSCACMWSFHHDPGSHSSNFPWGRDEIDQVRRYMSGAGPQVPSRPPPTMAGRREH